MLRYDCVSRCCQCRQIYGTSLNRGQFIRNSQFSPIDFQLANKKTTTSQTISGKQASFVIYYYYEIICNVWSHYTNGGKHTLVIEMCVRDISKCARPRPHHSGRYLLFLLCSDFKSPSYSIAVAVNNEKTTTVARLYECIASAKHVESTGENSSLCGMVRCPATRRIFLRAILSKMITIHAHTPNKQTALIDKITWYTVQCLPYPLAMQ